jgi:hypothetical protein
MQISCRRSGRRPHKSTLPLSGHWEQRARTDRRPAPACQPHCGLDGALLDLKCSVPSIGSYTVRPHAHGLNRLQVSYRSDHGQRNQPSACQVAI